MLQSDVHHSVTQSSTRLDWSRIAVGLQAALVVFVLLTTYVDFYPFVSIQVFDSSERLRNVAVFAGPFALMIPVFWLHNRPGMLAGAAWAWLWLALQILRWWIPYLTGSAGLAFLFGDPNVWYYDEGYRATTQLLPAISDHIRPNVQHLVLQVGTLCIAVVSTLAVLRHREGDKTAV
jgi:hypothetical protein